jgi:hypothetical protein
MTKDEALRLALEALETIERCEPSYSKIWSLKDNARLTITAIKAALQTKDEPAAWYRDEDGIRIYYESKVWDDAIPLYTTPPQRTWVGLTNDEIQTEWVLTPQHDKAEGIWFGRRLEAKLKEKNT